MRVIGLTGGTGAGKTTVLRWLESKGAAALDCDAIYHEMLRDNPMLRMELTDAFGELFLPDGTLDRAKLGKLVFGDAEKLRQLNTIVYYYMGLEIRCRLATLRAENRAMAAIDAINLIESGLGELCDVNVAVLAPEADRLRRIMARDGVSEEYALARIRAQQPDTYFRRHCRIVLNNDGGEAALLQDAEAQLIDFM